MTAGLFQKGDLVWYKNDVPGEVLENLGIITPPGGAAGLPTAFPPEQAYKIKVKFPSFIDERGAWESDLLPRKI